MCRHCKTTSDHDWYEKSYERDPDAEYISVTQSGLNDIKQSFSKVVNMLYGKDQLNLIKLDENLNWIALELGMKLPANNPNIQRTREESNLFSFAVHLSKQI